MRRYEDNQSDPQNDWNNEGAYPEPRDGGGYTDYEDYDEYDGYDDYEETDLDQELNSEHHFRIAMNVFDLISTLVGLAIILLLAGLLFNLIHWVQRDISQSLSIFSAPFL